MIDGIKTTGTRCHNGTALRSKKPGPGHALKRLTLTVSQDGQDCLHVQSRRFGIQLSEYVLRAHRLHTLIADWQEQVPGSRFYVETPDGTRTAVVFV